MSLTDRITPDLDWEDARELFPVTEDYAYFQTAAVTALPTPAREAIAEITREMAEDGCLNESSWVKQIETIRTRAARLIDAPPGRVGFVKNTSHGLSILANSLPLEAGDGIAVPHGEFPANVYPWMNRCEQDNLDFQPIPRAEDGGVYLDQIRETVEDHTRMLSLSSVQFHNGFRADLDTIGEFCRNNDLFFVVDGIQSVGWDPINCHDLAVDALVADGHKWMCGPEGIGIIYLEESFQSELSISNIGWKSVKQATAFSHWDFDLKEQANVVEEGSPNTIGLMALGASLKLIHNLHLEAIRERNMDLHDRAVDGLTDLGFRSPSTSWERTHQSPIISMDHPDLPMDVLDAACEEHNIQASLRNGQLRISLHFFNNEQDIQKLLDVADGVL